MNKPNYEHASLVRIGTGERREMLLDGTHVLSAPYVSAGLIADRIQAKGLKHTERDWSRIDETREAYAARYRAAIAMHRRAAEEAAAALLALYREPKATEVAP